jgi:hypothetical protein
MIIPTTIAEDPGLRHTRYLKRGKKNMAEFQLFN